MRAYICSPIDALILLRGLKQKAASMPGYLSSMNGYSSPRISENSSLVLARLIDGQPTYATISQHDSRTLVASLDREDGAGAATLKKRLAALLLPLISEYVGDCNSVTTREDRVRVVFGETMRKTKSGRTCILFAEKGSKGFSSGDKSTS